MRIALFLAFLLVASAYALWRGGGPERTMAAIAWTMVAADQLLHAFIPPEFATLDTGHLAIDLFGASATTALALYAHRFWPLCVAVLHMLPLLAHTSRVLDVTMQPAVSPASTLLHGSGGANRPGNTRTTYARPSSAKPP